MADQLLRALAFDGQVRVVVINAKDAVEEARRRHDTWYTATAALGRTMIGTVLLASSLKGDDRLSIEITGTGPIGKVLVYSDAQGNLRGYVNNPKVALELNQDGKIDVKGGIGLPGSVVVSKYIEDHEPFSGQVPLVSGEIAEDLTYYMAVSEQTPSSIGLSVLVDSDESVKQAGGFMLQLMPGATEETISALEQTITDMTSISELLESGITMEEFLAALVGADNFKVLDRMQVQFACPCSKERFAANIQLLGRQEIDTMIEEDHGAEVICHYCSEKYYYNEEELQELSKHAKP